MAHGMPSIGLNLRSIDQGTRLLNRSAFAILLFNLTARRLGKVNSKTINGLKGELTETSRHM